MLRWDQRTCRYLSCAALAYPWRIQAVNMQCSFLHQAVVKCCKEALPFCEAVSSRYLYRHTNTAGWMMKHTANSILTESLSIWFFCLLCLETHGKSLTLKSHIQHSVLPFTASTKSGSVLAWFTPSAVKNVSSCLSFLVILSDYTPALFMVLF